MGAHIPFGSPPSKHPHTDLAGLYPGLVCRERHVYLTLIYNIKDRPIVLGQTMFVPITQPMTTTRIGLYNTEEKQKIGSKGQVFHRKKIQIKRQIGQTVALKKK